MNFKTLDKIIKINFKKLNNYDEDVDTNFEKTYNVVENIIDDIFDDHKYKKNEIRHDIFNFGYHEINDYDYYYNIYEKMYNEYFRDIVRPVYLNNYSKKHVKLIKLKKTKIPHDIIDNVISEFL